MEKQITKKDFYTIVWEAGFSGEANITFNYPKPELFRKHDYDWYIKVALEKADLVKEDRHLLTSDLLLSYRWAIREGYNHQLDPNLQRQYDYPRNRNTIKGIQGYIDLIQKRSDDEMKSIDTL